MASDDGDGERRSAVQCLVECVEADARELEDVGADSLSTELE